MQVLFAYPCHVSSYVIVFDLISQCTRARLTRLYQPQCSHNAADHCIVDLLVRIIDLLDNPIN